MERKRTSLFPVAPQSCLIHEASLVKSSILLMLTQLTSTIYNPRKTLTNNQNTFQIVKQLNHSQSQLNLTSSLWDKYYYHSHLLDEETESQRNCINCPSPIPTCPVRTGIKAFRLQSRALSSLHCEEELLGGWELHS